MSMPPEDQSNTGWVPSVWRSADAPPDPPKPSKARRGALVAIALIALAGIAALAVGILRSDDSPKVAGPPTTVITYPPTWDPRVVQLADEASRLRKLNFLHPVQVEFLTPAEYTKKSAGSEDEDSLSKKDRSQIADYVALYRSVGLLSGKVDLFNSMKTLADTGTLAFYDPTDKHVYIRGTKMTVDLRITLVHELTHVLQDQHFDLLKIEKAADRSNGDSMAVHALVEGDAEEIESQAVDQLSAADKKTYLASQERLSSNDDAKKLLALPKVFVDSFSAPYDFGEQFVKILKDQGGESAIDAAFRKPPTSFAEIWNPFAYLEGQKPLAVTAPRLPKGAKKVDASQVGSFDTFLVFAERLPALQSLDAADAWRGDRSLTYRKDGTVCTEIRMRAGDTAGATTLLQAWRDWKEAMPGGLASVRAMAGNGVVIHTCDPGPDVDLHVSDKGDKALVYPVGRLQVATSVLDESKKGTAIHMSPAAAYCFADAILRIVPVDALSGADPNWQPDIFQQSKMADARDSCLARHP
jgi:hypothetical protein